MTVLTTLAWHHFFRSFYGNPEQCAAARSYAARMAELAEELGAADLSVHGWSLLAIQARLTGGPRRGVGLRRRPRAGSRSLKQNDRWFAWAATFSVTVARGAWGVTPPFPPDDTADPVAAMAGLIIEAELAFGTGPGGARTLRGLEAS